MLRVGNVQLATNLLLAPLAGYTDLAFRLVVRSVPGANGHGSLGLAFTELICSSAIVHATNKTLAMASTNAADQPLGMQLYGRDPQILAEAARWAQAHGATLIDINMGCPVDKVTKTNGGSKLLGEPDLALAIARRVVQAVTIPVTAKIRLGWDDTCLIGPDLAPKLADQGVALITVHGRTTEQMFRGRVRLADISQVVEAVKRRHPHVPVIGNGDVQTPQDAKAMLDATGCDGVMIGRGALGQPWIFRDTAHYLATGQLPPPLSRSERATLVLEHFENLVRLRDQRVALNVMRQRIGWYSAALQPWPHLRRDVSVMPSAERFRAYLTEGIQQLRAAEREPVRLPSLPFSGGGERVG